MIAVPVRKVEGAAESPEQDLLAVEEPLEIRVNGHNVAITMRTPGNDEELAAGFLFTEGILRAPAQIVSVTSAAPNTIDVTVPDEVDLERLHRNFYVSSSCGVCGKASIDAIELTACPMLDRSRPVVAWETIHRLPEQLRARQAVFDRTGGLHAAALFDASGDLLEVREDVGRHNAVDKLIGAAFLRSAVPLAQHILLVSGRASFELAQKAAMGGIGMLAAVGAPSSLAVEVALRFGMTLCGFVRDRRFNVYSGAWRVTSSPVGK
jgi:FdhD protein